MCLWAGGCRESATRYFDCQGHPRAVPPPVGCKGIHLDPPSIMVENRKINGGATRTKMLKPEKWQACFDSNGKVIGFRKALKLIVLGGVDPSIRAEVWEFLLGCYRLSSTAECRKQLRIARRERYEDLIKQCQMMHSSVGTGNLAYVVGSKVMDARTMSNNNTKKEEEIRSGLASQHASNTVEAENDLKNGCMDSSYAWQRESSSDSADLASVRGSTDSAAYGSSCAVPSSKEYATESYFDFPPLPVTDLFQKDDGDEIECEPYSSRRQEDQSFSLEEEPMHKAAMINAIKSNGMTASEERVSEWLWTLHRIVVDVVRTDSHLEFYEDSKNMARMSDILAVYAWVDPATGYCQGYSFAFALLTPFFQNMLVTCRRVDHQPHPWPDGIYIRGNLSGRSTPVSLSGLLSSMMNMCHNGSLCLGGGATASMSDLLSPFVVLYEDNADAFWCFEMLLRRMRDNFQMEGPTGVMKQLQALWKILELTDAELFRHLSVVGAESLHFAFRMLLVLFRRELSFDEALCMWEMIWAADFDEAVARELEENCLEPLALQLPRESDAEPVLQAVENGKSDLKGTQTEHCNIESSDDDNEMESGSKYPFCGLTRASFWARHEDRMRISSMTSSTRNGDDELPVFCVASVLIMHRHKIMKRTHSIDDLIKVTLNEYNRKHYHRMFNDKKLKIKVKRCIRMAIKLKKKYLYKVELQNSF
ncbi:hypothetical protein ACLOJK_011743 [Asimina triloba]